VQYYLFSAAQVFLREHEVLCPELYLETGHFIIRLGENFNYGLLKSGDVIFAERLRKAAPFTKYNDYLVRLHTAIYVGTPGKEIWHASIIAGSACSWSIEEFQTHYFPVAAKRIIQ